jgi:hypothetical protein
MIYLLTAIMLTPGGSSTVHIWLTPGGSSTVHIYIQIIHRTTQRYRIHRILHTQQYEYINITIKYIIYSIKQKHKNIQQKHTNYKTLPCNLGSAGRASSLRVIPWHLP